MVHHIIDLDLDAIKYGSHTEESESQKFVEGHITERKPSCLAKFQEGLRTWKHQILGGGGWREGLMIDGRSKIDLKKQQHKNLWAPPDPATSHTDEASLLLLSSNDVDEVAK